MPVHPDASAFAIQRIVKRFAVRRTTEGLVAIESGRRQLSFAGADARDHVRLRPQHLLEPAAQADD
jgi:hypothetical protein